MIYNFNTKKNLLLAQVGGKAKSLIETTRAGFIVPEGFVLSVEFFDGWTNSLKERNEWKAFLDEPTKVNCDILKRFASTLIFDKEKLDLIEGELKKLSEDTLFAIRSSSPEEDLEGTSFAGQYETVLGVKKEGIVKAINDAFISMLDTRVVEYKKLNNIAIDNPKIAIIVQKQIKSDISGIAFSLNPNNNAFDEAMINASFGLGETIVSGQVTPDTYIVDKVNNKIISKNVMNKEVSLWLKEGGGTEEKENINANEQALSDAHIVLVSRLAIKCEVYYKKPIDIEWAFEDDKLYLLQARPITTHIPFAKEMLTEAGETKNLYLDLTILTQGFEDNFSVLGQEIWTLMVSEVKMGLLPEGRDGIVFNVHGRQYMHISNWAKGLGVGTVKKAMGNYEVPIRKIFENLDIKKDFMPKKKSAKLKKLTRDSIKLVFKLIPKLIWSMSDPKKSADRYNNASIKAFKYMKDDLNKIEYFDEMVDDGIKNFAYLSKHAVGLVAGMTSYASIKKMFKGMGLDDQIIALSMDLKNNPTSAMGHEILKLASFEDIKNTDSSEEFIEKLENLSYSKKFQMAYDNYMIKYGARGFKEIDISTPRTYENPIEFFKQLKAINVDNNQINTVKERKDKAYNELLISARKISRENSFIKKANTYNELMGYREDPKYIYVIMVGELRKVVLKIADSFVEEGRLDDASQIFDLTIAQITRAQKNRHIDLKDLIEINLAPRKALAHIKNWPKVVDSRGKIYRYVRDSEEGDLVGDPIAPGTIRGRAKVLHTPYEKPLLEGEILVARATEPAWTPIFVNAAGVVLEIGGPLQHGAIIAREYGIPCVSGLDDITKLIKDGDLLEVDGSSGIVKIIEE